MKTPDEIKKGLECYRAKHPYSIGRCPEGCPYEKNGEFCRNMLNMDALAYIQQLESRLAQVERERDAALKDIANTCWSCGNTKPSQLSKFLYSCPHLKGKAGVRTQCEHWQWRGVCPENTKEEST